MRAMQWMPSPFHQWLFEVASFALEVHALSFNLKQALYTFERRASVALSSLKSSLQLRILPRSNTVDARYTTPERLVLRLQKHWTFRSSILSCIRQVFTHKLDPGIPTKLTAEES